MSATIVATNVRAFLQTQHPFHVAQCVARRSHIPVATVRKWFERGSAPSAAHMGQLFMAYGIEVVAAAYPCEKAQRLQLLAQEDDLRLRADATRREIQGML